MPSSPAKNIASSRNSINAQVVPQKYCQARPPNRAAYRYLGLLRARCKEGVESTRLAPDTVESLVVAARLCWLPVAGAVIWRDLAYRARTFRCAPEFSYLTAYLSSIRVCALHSGQYLACFDAYPLGGKIWRLASGCFRQ